MSEIHWQSFSFIYKTFYYRAQLVLYKFSKVLHNNFILFENEFGTFAFD